jgi:hypothetical protein
MRGATAARTLFAFACVAAAAPARAEVQFFPDATVRLMAARYQPTEADLHWTGWIGAGAGLVRVNGVTGYGMAEVETILGDTLRVFEANQANYHLELGLRRTFGTFEVGPFFHHVSRHYVDRPKVQAVDWNVFGLRAAGTLHPGGRPLQVGGSLGHTTQASLPGYRWEATAFAEIALRDEAATQPYARVNARAVTVRDAATATTETLDRGGFLDRAAEAGVRLARGAHSVDLFVAWERRNDVFLEVPGARSRALLGLRIQARSR